MCVSAVCGAVDQNSRVPTRESCRLRCGSFGEMSDLWIGCFVSRGGVDVAGVVDAVVTFD